MNTIQPALKPLSPLWLIVAFLFILQGCAQFPSAPEADKDETLSLKEVSYSSLKGWNSDPVHQSFRAFKKSCDVILKRDPEAPFSSRQPYAGLNKDWQPACRTLDNIPAHQARGFFERYFTPYQVYADNDKQGLFTGYYEASLKGSLKKRAPYTTPLLKKPDDLVMVDLGDFREDLKGRRIAGRVINATLQPYADRAAIVEGALDEDELALVYVDDAVDAFFLHIQGSGRIELDDGSVMRVGYAGQNGHPYHPIGRTLVEKGVLEKDGVSLQSIKAWLAENKDQADMIKNTNPSYIFFRELPEEGPIGGSGLSLTPGRSLAIDHTEIPYHVPIFVDIDMPVLKAEDENKRIQRLMVAQDTGGAIRGPVRGDFFWGYGDRAENYAGIMKSKGQKWLLLPRSIDQTRLPLK